MLDRVVAAAGGDDDGTIETPGRARTAVPAGVAASWTELDRAVACSVIGKGSVVARCCKETMWRQNCGASARMNWQS
jgi:hypothetical protein